MARSEICKNCCPQGGALFTREFGCFPHHATKEEMEEYASVKVCNNCGHYKPFRKVAPRLSFDEIIAQPDDSKLRNKRQWAIFHAFSENGAWKQYCNAADAYEAECRAQGVTKWPILMHKWMNDHHRNALTDDIGKLTAWEVSHHTRRLKDQALRAEELLEKDFLESRAAR